MTLNTLLTEDDSRNILANGVQFVQGTSASMHALNRVIDDIAPTDIPVLLVGESGTGKEVVALEIHRRSRRSNEPVLKCACGSSVPSWLMRPLNANSHRGNGASLGTIFLDEVDRLDADNQNTLLEFLPDNSGMSTEHFSTARMISATTHNLETDVRAQRFREELYYRINGITLRLEPLRKRKEDIPVLLEFFLTGYSSLFGRSERRLGATTIDHLLRYSWPGNVRELSNVARNIVVLGDEQLAIRDLPIHNPSEEAGVVTKAILAGARTNGPSLKDVAREATRKAEHAMILKALDRTRWNRKRTAKDLQISYKALLYKMKQLGLDEEPFSSVPSRPL
jgi:two-component system response regulator AtoC